jgi:hypothetical protein
MEVLSACGESAKGVMFEIAVHKTIRDKLPAAGDGATGTNPPVPYNLTSTTGSFKFNAYDHVFISHSYTDYPSDDVKHNGYAATYRLYDCISHVLRNLRDYVYTVAPTGCTLFDSFVCETVSGLGSQKTLLFHAFQITVGDRHGLNQSLWDTFTSQLELKLKAHSTPYSSVSFTFTYILHEDVAFTSLHKTPDHLARRAIVLNDASQLLALCTLANNIVGK